MEIEKIWEGSEWRYAEKGTRLRYPVNNETAEHVAQINWANGILAAPCVTYPNGRVSHEVAAQVLEEHSLALIDHLAIAA